MCLECWGGAFILLVAIGIHLTMTYEPKSRPKKKREKIVNAIIDDEPVQKIPEKKLDVGKEFDLSGCENGQCHV